MAIGAKTLARTGLSLPRRASFASKAGSAPVVIEPLAHLANSAIDGSSPLPLEIVTLATTALAVTSTQVASPLVGPAP